MDHHPTYDSFINAVLKGCYICVLLWERIPQDAKSALPKLRSDCALLRCKYFMQQDDKSPRRLRPLNPLNFDRKARISLLGLPGISSRVSFLINLSGNRLPKLYYTILVLIITSSSKNLRFLAIDPDWHFTANTVNWLSRAPDSSGKV